MLACDVTFHLHKSDVTMVEKIGDKVFLFFMLQTINPTTETKTIMKFPRGSHFYTRSRTTCQISLVKLAVRLNELETALIYNNKIKLILK